MKAEKPLPVVDADNAGYWEAAQAGELRIQRCTSCGRHRHPPLPACPQCHSLESDWARSAGRGRLYTWTVVRHAVHPAFTDLPYVIALIELDDCDGARLICNLDVAPDELTAGSAVQIVFEQRGEAALPQARLV